ncbi:MAG: hypothetical protein IKL52_05930 [Candidatus Gastranaerophilales bacterium]|nr:hypothetical protein [Candidatus Gastranaerophilales bacterium]
MKKRVYAYLHTHWDLEWYRDKEDFNLRLLDVVDIIIKELKNDKAPFFYLDGQVIALLDYLKYRPEKKEEIISLIKAQKLAIGPFFVSADSYLINFCSMLKNLDLGMKIAKEFEQKKNYIGYMSDIFGVSNSIFEALKLKNIDKALIWRGVNPNKINNNCNFIKNDIKTSWLVQGYFNDFLHNDNIEGLKNYLDKIAKYSNNALLLPIGADHLGMLQDASKKIKKANSKLKDYEIVLTSPFEYFKHSNFNNATKEKEFLDNSDTYILQGVYSSRIPQKIRNSEIQNSLSRTIEPLNYYLKENYSTNIEELYKTLIKNHAHDGIYGCSIDSVHKTVDSRLNKCECTINALLKRFIGNFKTKNKIKGESKDKIGVINLSNNELNSIEVKLPYILPNSQILNVEEGFSDDLLYDCYKIPVTEDICKQYHQIVEISKNNSLEFNTVKIKKPINKVKVTSTSIENDYIKLSSKNNKIEITDKKTNECFDLKLTDIKDIGDSYNFAPSGNYKELKLLKSEVKYKGNIQSALKLSFKNVELNAILDNNAKFIKFKSIINNKTKNHKLQLVLILKDKITRTIAQDAIGIIERKVDPDYKMQDFMPAKRPIELKTNCFPMQNFVCANGALILTKGLHEYEIYKNELRVCLLRATDTISNPKNPARSIPAGPNLKTPDCQCIGEIQSEFILSFGNYKKAFKLIDDLFKNYLVIDGEFEKEINIKYDEIPNNSYFYGINNNKKIIYNYKEDKILMI